MNVDPFNTGLPVAEIIPQVKGILEDSNSLIVSAPPGAGKSTLLPLILMNEPWLNGKKILMLEPRRLAARTIAARMSSLLNDQVGQQVGFRIRFETCVSEHTRIEVLTEGILTRMLHTDKQLADVGLVIFDEFHERSIHADVAMALCRETQQLHRPDLRIMVMSATLDMPALSKLLHAPVVTSKGKLFPVDIRYTGDADAALLPEFTARVVKKAIKENEGDVLVFLPGQGEIKRSEAILRKELKDIAIHTLYGQLPPSKQYAALMPDKSRKRKIVLATSIAETSLTIEGVKIVIDSGFGKTTRFDPNSGLSRLETIRISNDSADQRAGRAGRLAPGVCYRMWAEKDNHKRQKFRTPEILEADLSPLVLDMAQWGIKNIHQLTWLSPPPHSSVAQARETLRQLSAIEQGAITEHGRRIHALPCHPRIAHMLVMAENENKLGLATDLAAILEERDPLPPDSGIDINLRIKALRRYRKEAGKGKRLGKIEKIARSYRRLCSIEAENGEWDPYETGVLLAHAFPERIAFARPGNNAQFQLANGKYAFASHKDTLASDAWLSIAQLDAREGLGKIFMASPLNPRDLAPLLKEQKVVKWDTDTGELKASKDLRIGSIVLKSSPLPAPEEQFRTEAIAEAIVAEGEELLNFHEAVTNWQNRVLSLRKWRPQEGWPDVSTQTLLLTNRDWLSHLYPEIEHPDDLFSIDLREILSDFFLNDEQQKALDRLAPVHYAFPSGMSLPVTYNENGNNPGIRVDLQELVGLSESPAVNEGYTDIDLLIVGPDSRTISLVSDLSCFWHDTYPKMREELVRNYPSVQWP